MDKIKIIEHPSGKGKLCWLDTPEGPVKLTEAEAVMMLAGENQIDENETTGSYYESADESTEESEATPANESSEAVESKSSRLQVLRFGYNVLKTTVKVAMPVAIVAAPYAVVTEIVTEANTDREYEIPSDTWGDITQFKQDLIDLPRNAADVVGWPMTMLFDDKDTSQKSDEQKGLNS